MTLKIRNFQQQSDVLFAAQLTQKENWRSETDKEMGTFFAHDPDGCFIAEVNGKPVGICVATAYQQNGFIGELIVIPEARGKGVGKALLHSSLDYFQSKNIQQVYLDGVIKAVPLYEKTGFKTINRSLRFFGQIPGEPDINCEPITTDNIQPVLDLDQKLFGDDRGFFLNKRVENYPHLCFILFAENKIQGYLFGREGHGGWITVGPWVSLLPVEQGFSLIKHFQHEIGNQPFSIGILEHQTAVTRTLVLHGLQPQPDPPKRMGYQTQENLGDSPFCFAIGSPAKG